jgi:hypothetical protein
MTGVIAEMIARSRKVFAKKGANPWLYTTLALTILTAPFAHGRIAHLIDKLAERDAKEFSEPARMPDKKEPGKKKAQEYQWQNPDHMRLKGSEPSVAEYPSFKHQDEIEYALRHAQRRGVEPELLLAIRMAENGGEGRELGVISGGERYNKDLGYINKAGKFVKYKDETEKQYAWCAAILQKRWKEFNALSEGEQMKYAGFIGFLKGIYCPGEEGVNKHWEPNVTKIYNKLKSERKA